MSAERHQTFITLPFQSLMDTATEFSKLEKIELGGVQGKSLSAQVEAIFADFQEQFKVFSEGTFDCLNPAEPVSIIIRVHCSFCRCFARCYPKDLMSKNIATFRFEWQYSLKIYLKRMQHFLHRYLFFCEVFHNLCLNLWLVIYLLNQSF